MTRLAHRIALAGVAALFLLGAVGTPPVPTPLLTEVADVRLPGTASRFDYAALDRSTGRLYLDHMGASEVVVFDVATRRTLAVIHGVPRCTGLRVVPALHRLFVSAAGAHQVVAIDTRTNHVLARLPAGRFPDGIDYAPESGRVFVSDEAGGQVIAIDARKLRVVGRVALGGEAGNTRVDPTSHRVYTNDQTSGRLVVIDPGRLAVVARIPLGIKGNHGLYLDLPHHLAYVASEDVDRLLVMDLRTRRVIAHFLLGHEPDVLDLDPGTGTLYVASESGVVSVLRLRQGRLAKVGDVRAGPNAHVVVVDPASHLVYLPLGRLHGHPALRIMAPAGAGGAR